jgi:hypothetical protein
MSSTSTPVLPVLTARTRYYGKIFNHPSLTIRQRYTPSPQRSDNPISSPISPVFPGSFVTLVTKIIPQDPKSESKVDSQVAGRDSPQTKADERLPEELVLTIENDGLIPKPLGEPGRKVGLRGYNLEDALKWPTEEMTEMKVRIDYLIDTLTV